MQTQSWPKCIDVFICFPCTVLLWWEGHAQPRWMHSSPNLHEPRERSWETLRSCAELSIIYNWQLGHCVLDSNVPWKPIHESPFVAFSYKKSVMQGAHRFQNESYIFLINCRTVHYKDNFNNRNADDHSLVAQKHGTVKSCNDLTNPQETLTQTEFTTGNKYLGL